MKEKRLINYGNVFNPNHQGSSFAGYVYGLKGIAPCLTTMSGGTRMPLVIVNEGNKSGQSN